MIPWWLGVLTGAAAAIVAFAALAFPYMRSTIDKSFDLGVQSGEARCIKETLALNRRSGVRVLIDVIDFGEEWGDTRWHWTLWDADKYLLPKTQELGVIRPYREGAASTQGFAFSQAIQAVLDMRAESGVDVQVVTR